MPPMQLLDSKVGVPMLTINQLLIAYSEQLWFEFDKPEKILLDQSEYSNSGARWNAYLNRLCLETFLQWLQQEADINEQPLVFPSLTDLPSIWDVVNGTAITLGHTRLVLIPSDTVDIKEFCVPAEWIDIPNWRGNYYLAVQINLIDGWLRVWGYATYQQLKYEGTYDKFDCTYSLDAEDLTESLNVMWVARELCPDEIVEVKPLPILSPTQAEILIAQLSQVSDYSPRLDVDFEQWGALLANDSWRQQLYEKRREVVPVVAPDENLINLKLWLQHNFVEATKAGWEALEAFLVPEQQKLAFAFRGGSNRFRAEANNITQAKLIDLGMELGGEAVVLLIAITPQVDERIGVLVQVHPTADKRHLPHLLTLALLSESGEILQQVRSRTSDNFIQLKYFRVQPDTHLSMLVSLGNVSVREYFKI